MLTSNIASHANSARVNDFNQDDLDDLRNKSYELAGLSKAPPGDLEEISEELVLLAHMGELLPPFIGRALDADSFQEFGDQFSEAYSFVGDADVDESVYQNDQREIQSCLASSIERIDDNELGYNMLVGMMNALSDPSEDVSMVFSNDTDELNENFDAFPWGHLDNKMDNDQIDTVIKATLSCLLKVLILDNSKRLEKELQRLQRRNI